MVPVSRFSLLVEIDVDSTNDEELILFLGGRSIVDPVPTNVITEINPFSIDPRDYSERIWFLYKSNYSQSHNEGSFIKAKNGYWRSIGNLKIITSTPIKGTKMTREFCLGDIPIGNRTDLRMHEYCTEPAVSQETYSLCRFFLHNSEASNVEECGCNVRNVASSAPIPIPAINQEKWNSSKISASQVLNNCENREPSDLANVADHEEFIELYDINYGEDSGDSGSDNSSMNSDECFDAEAMIRDIENNGVATEVTSDQVVVQSPPSSEAMIKDIENNGVATEVTSDRVVVQSPPPSSVNGPQNEGDGSTSSSSRGGRDGSNNSENNSPSSSSSIRSRF